MKNELRIGNYVKTYNDFVIKSYSAEGLYNIMKRIDEYKPIPLTEEWLLKFGFDKILNFHSSVGYSIKDFTIWMYTVNEFTYGKTTIKYVHQLQNLYFALTNEELTI